MCQKDYVELSTRQKYCGNRTGAFLIRNNKAVIDFVTDDSNSGTGFSGTITALCKFMYLYWQGGKCYIIFYFYFWFWKHLQQATKLHIKLFLCKYVFDRTDFFWLFPMQNLVNLKIFRMFDFYVFQYFLHNKNPTSHLLLLTMTVSLYQSIIFFCKYFHKLIKLFNIVSFIFIWFIFKDPPSSKPTNPSLSKTQYGFLVKWTEPLVNPGLVRGYRVSYKHADRSMVRVIIVSANENVAFINTQSYPGSWYEVWISAIGETEDSEETYHMYSYSGNSIC